MIGNQEAGSRRELSNTQVSEIFQREQVDFPFRWEKEKNQSSFDM